MSDRMEKEISRTIELLQASMPQKRSGTKPLQLLGVARSEISPLLLLVLFLLSVLAGTCLSKHIASPMVSVFCISPLPMLILFHKYVLRTNEPMRELEETLPFSYSEMLAGRTAYISGYMVLIFLALAGLLSRPAGGVFLRLALCGAVPSVYLSLILLLVSVFVREQGGLALAAGVSWVGISYCALVLPFDRVLALLPTALYGLLLAVGAALCGLCACKIKRRRFSYAAGIR